MNRAPLPSYAPTSGICFAAHCAASPKGGATVAGSAAARHAGARAAKRSHTMGRWENKGS